MSAGGIRIAGWGEKVMIARDAGCVELASEDEVMSVTGKEERCRCADRRKKRSAESRTWHPGCLLELRELGPTPCLRLCVAGGCPLSAVTGQGVLQGFAGEQRIWRLEHHINSSFTFDPPCS